jgi:methanethiol oxidase
MAIWRPDPSFYPSPKMAMQGPQEKLAYVAVLTPNAALNSNGDGRPDVLALFDVDPNSESCGQVVGHVEMPNAGDELHHFGWNACSSALCPYAPHPHVERRYLIVPGLRSSRMHIIDTKPNPREPRIVKVIEPDELHDRTGYSRPHTIHCGPEGIYVSALGAGGSWGS